MRTDEENLMGGDYVLPPVMETDATMNNTETVDRGIGARFLEFGGGGGHFEGFYHETKGARMVRGERRNDGERTVEKDAEDHRQCHQLGGLDRSSLTGSCFSLEMLAWKEVLGWIRSSTLINYL